MADNRFIAKRIVAEDLRCAAVIATSYGCPFEGRVSMNRVLDIAEQFAAAGATEVGFGDTTGMANPAYVEEFFTAAIERLRGVEVTAHFHKHRGQGLANEYAAFRADAPASSPASANSAAAPCRRIHRKHLVGGSDQHVRGDGACPRGCPCPRSSTLPARLRASWPQTDQPLH